MLEGLLNLSGRDRRGTTAERGTGLRGMIGQVFTGEDEYDDGNNRRRRSNQHGNDVDFDDDDDDTRRGSSGRYRSIGRD